MPKIRNGPNIEEIARVTGIFRETVRYRCKKRILERGLTLHAVLDYERLGMSKMLAIARLNEELEPSSKAILGEMNKLCYLYRVLVRRPDRGILARSHHPEFTARRGR